MVTFTPRRKEKKPNEKKIKKNEETKPIFVSSYLETAELKFGM